MTGKQLLEELLDAYTSSYDIQRGAAVDGDVYDAYASFSVTSAKYVLIKKAELWRANCFEHTFFRITDQLTVADLERFRAQIFDYIEPRLVRQGKKRPEKDHMYTYITGVFLCDGGVSDEAKKAIKRFRFVKNYLCTIRGYSEARLLVFDLKAGRILGNRAAKELVKGYTKMDILQLSKHKSNEGETKQ